MSTADRSRLRNLLIPRDTSRDVLLALLGALPSDAVLTLADTLSLRNQIILQFVSEDFAAVGRADPIPFLTGEVDGHGGVKWNG